MKVTLGNRQVNSFNEAKFDKWLVKMVNEALKLNALETYLENGIDKGGE